MAQIAAALFGLARLRAAVLGRGTSPVLLECAVEVWYVGEARMIAHFGYRHASLPQQLTRQPYPIFVQIGNEGLSRSLLEEGAEGRLVHTYMTDNIVEGDVTLQIGRAHV